MCAVSSSRPFRLGGWWVEPQTNELRRDGATVHLEPRAMDVLVCLAARPGETRARAEILDEVWGDAHVVDGVVSRAIYALRRALGDDAQTPAYIQTVPRRGYRLVAEVSRVGSVDDVDSDRSGTAISSAGGESTRSRRWLVASALLVSTVLLVVVVSAPGPPAVVSRLVVQPFADGSLDGSGELLAVGTTEAVVSALAGSERVTIYVEPEGSAGMAPDRAPVRSPERAGEARLSGSVTRDQGLVSVTARITRADGEVLWGEVYEAPLERIRALHAGLARDVAAVLGQTVQTPASWERPVDARAYRLWLSGRRHLEDRNAPAFERAVLAFEGALEIEPEFADAEAGLAEAFLLLGDYLGRPETEARHRAAKHAARALELEPESPRALAAAARVALDGAWDLGEAERLARGALERAPGDGEIRLFLAEVLGYRGAHAVALEESRSALAATPWSLLAQARHGKLLLRAGRYREAERALTAVVAHAPTFGWVERYRAYALERLGRHDEALAVWRGHIAMDDRLGADARSRSAELIDSMASAGHWRWRLESYRERLERGGRPHPAAIAEAHAGLGELGEARRWLDRALEERDDWLLDLLMSPAFDALRGPELEGRLAEHGVAHLARLPPASESEPRSAR